MKRVLVFGGLVGLLLLCGCGKKADSGPSGAGWSGFDPEQGKFTVAMPGTPTEKPLDGSAGKSWTSSADGLTYTVSYAELQIPPEPPTRIKVEQWMDNEVEVLLDHRRRNAHWTKEAVDGRQPAGARSRYRRRRQDGAPHSHVRRRQSPLPRGSVRPERQSRRARGRFVSRFVPGGEIGLRLQLRQLLPIPRDGQPSSYLKPVACSLKP